MIPCISCSEQAAYALIASLHSGERTSAASHAASASSSAWHCRGRLGALQAKGEYELRACRDTYHRKRHSLVASGLEARKIDLQGSLPCNFIVERSNSKRSTGLALNFRVGLYKRVSKPPFKALSKNDVLPAMAGHFII